MNYIENAKQYTGSELETVFFRPMLTGGSARELGVRILYNMPTPPTSSCGTGSATSSRNMPTPDGREAPPRPSSRRRSTCSA